jgi:hypothetical protein
VSYGSRRPDSRRDRRRAKGASRRPEGADRTFLVVAGLFFLVLLLLVAALALFG